MGSLEDINQFEIEWTDLGKEICHNVYYASEVQDLKKHLQENGFLSLEEKSEFINLTDKIKYQTIYNKYGPEGSDGYNKFSAAWRRWFEAKGVESAKERTRRNNVDHILFGSTPDPVEFLNGVEKELT